MATNFDWDTFTEEDKTHLRGLKATFVMASRELSNKRLAELVKEHLSKGNVIFGIAKEPFIDGFNAQPQFRSLAAEPVLRLAEIIAKTNLPHTLCTFSYPQNSVDDIIRAVRPNNVVVVRGSYLHVFHRRSTYTLLQKRGISFELVSPFLNEAEARAYPGQAPTKGALTSRGGDAEMLAVAHEIATASFDYSFQTGTVLAVKEGDSYVLLDAACNEVVPYQTYALHFGNSREENLSPSHDANHYDTIHAEMNLLVRAMTRGVSFEGKSLFINMLPCPSCARTLVKTGLEEVIYQQVHSDGYAVKLFSEAGIKTRKVE